MPPQLPTADQSSAVRFGKKCGGNPKCQSLEWIFSSYHRRRTALTAPKRTETRLHPRGLMGPRSMRPCMRTLAHASARWSRCMCRMVKRLTKKCVPPECLAIGRTRERAVLHTTTELLYYCCSLFSALPRQQALTLFSLVLNPIEHGPTKCMYSFR